MTSSGSPQSSTSTPASSSSTDLVQSAVYRYLQRRRYAPAVADTYKRISHPPKDSLSQSKQAMALREVLNNETSADNVFTFSAHITDPIVIDQQYSKFKIWISESPDSYKPELAQLLYPVFTHLYLEMVGSGQKLPATKFLKKHQSTFLGNAEFANFLRQLSSVTLPEELARDEIVAAYHTSKYSVTLSNRTFHYLMKYLQQDKQPPVLLQILHSKVDLRLSDALGACSKVEAVDRLRQEPQLEDEVDGLQAVKRDFMTGRNLDFDLTTNHMLKKTDEVQKLQDTIRNVRENVTPLPSTCLYRLSSDASSVTSSRLSADACHMAVGSEDSSIHLWSLFPSTPSHTSSVDQLNENAASSLGLACRTHSSDSQTSSSSFINRNNSASDSGHNLVLRGHSGPVYGLAFIPDTKLLVSCSEDTTMRVWDYATGVNRALYRGHSYPIWSVDSDRLGLNIATGSMDRTAKLWHLEYTFPLRMYAGHEKDVDVVRFHPNCNYLATAGADKTVRLWSHADAKMVRVFSGHRGGIFSLAFSPDGKVLASGGEDRRIRLWDLATSSLLKELRGHSDTIYSMVWSGDSSLLASGGLDGTVRIWNINGGQCNINGPQSEAQGNVSSEIVATYPTSCSNIIDLCYSPHNTLVATGVGSNFGMSSSNLGVIKNFQILNGGSGTT